jgi:hypothetical protein
MPLAFTATPGQPAIVKKESDRDFKVFDRKFDS